MARPELDAPPAPPPLGSTIRAETALPLPDLLHGRRHAPVDRALIRELLDTPLLGAEPETAVTGGDPGGPGTEGGGGAAVSPWRPEAFQDDLFLSDLVADAFRLEWRGRRYPVARRFLLRQLGSPPVDPEVIRFRQGILEELADDGDLRREAYQLFRDLFTLLSLLKSPRSAQLDARTFRLEVLEQAKTAVERMADGFAGARSGLRRLSEVGDEIRATDAWSLLTDLLEIEGDLGRVTVELRLGADGDLRDLQVLRLAENATNRHYKTPWRRWWDRLRLLWRGHFLSRKEVVNRLIAEVFLEVSPALRTLLQVMGHLQVHLTAMSFRDWAANLGLEVCLPQVSPGAPLRLEGLFNPLLVRQGRIPVPCDVAASERHRVVLVTGPNSGGKTRLLQAVGVTQVLGQSGLWVPARRARLPVVEGLFASILDHEDVGQIEGRLGSELLRIRRLFEVARPGSLVILDELCSGTNPSEAVEIFTMVLELLDRLSPLAFISTHFLDFARGLADRPPIPDLEFLQVEMDRHRRSTYQFIEGVATTSMAAGTAKRLGVSREELAKLIEARVGEGVVEDLVTGER